ncbi:MAG: hypothetical protein COA89_17560 [Acidithiobacillus sp.]|jgi:hypothetical protein|nr:MAG: hypothetical protein COA89_17560 [Acidithiobacillus sp.]HIA42424.1 hypothetical protein [Gammaproteobacteria bacterium]HIB81386.1 hypothetical protein [Gammaproteobacteria bacterium]HIC20393.1 hypothetical protein [Gammaproteobacteria bacterium]
MINGTAQEFSGLFNLPGEGFVAQLRNSTGTVLYDKQGLQFLILQRKESGLETRAAEEALARINTLSVTLAVQPV